MKIIFISHDASRTGAPRVLLNFIKWLLKNDPSIKPVILVKEGGDLLSEFRNLGSTFIWDPIHRPSSRISIFIYLVFWKLFFRRLYQAILSFRLKLTQPQCIYSNTFANGNLLSLLKHSNTKVITHVHELYHTINKLGKLNRDLVIGYTDHYIAASELVKQELIRYQSISNIKIDKVFECQLESNSSSVLNKSVDRKEYFFVGGAGNTDWRKGADLFVQMGIDLSVRYPDIPFKFVWIGQNGGGVSDFYDNLIYDLERTELRGMFVFTGLVDSPANWFAKLDIFVCSAREDPFPLTIIENAQLKNPIVCFDKGVGSAELITSGENGILVPYLNIHALSDAVYNLYLDDMKRFKIGEEGYRTFQSLTDSDQVFRQIHKIIKTLC